MVVDTDFPNYRAAIRVKSDQLQTSLEFRTQRASENVIKHARFLVFGKCTEHQGWVRSDDRKKIEYLKDLVNSYVA